MITAPARSGLVIPLQVTLLDLGKKSLGTGIAVDSLPIRRGVRLLERKLFATAMKLPARAFFFANARTHFRLGAGSKTLSRVEMRPRRAWLETGRPRPQSTSSHQHPCLVRTSRDVPSCFFESGVYIHFLFLFIHRNPWIQKNENRKTRCTRHAIVRASSFRVPPQYVGCAESCDFVTTTSPCSI